MHAWVYTRLAQSRSGSLLVLEGCLCNCVTVYFIMLANMLVYVSVTVSCRGKREGLRCKPQPLHCIVNHGTLSDAHSLPLESL